MAGRAEYAMGLNKPILTELEPKHVMAWINNVQAYSEVSQAAGVVPHPRGLMTPALYVAARDIYVEYGDPKSFPAYVKRTGTDGVEFLEEDKELLRPPLSDDERSGVGDMSVLARAELLAMLTHGLLRWVRKAFEKIDWDRVSVTRALRNVKWRPDTVWETAFRPYVLLIHQVYEETGLALVEGTTPSAPKPVPKTLQRVAVKALAAGLEPASWRHLVQTHIDVHGLKSVAAYLEWMKDNRAKYETLAAAAKAASRDSRSDEGPGVSRADAPGGADRSGVGGGHGRSDKRGSRDHGRGGQRGSV
jgi:hypothetical protein